MAEKITDTTFNPSGKESIGWIKESSADLAGLIQNNCPDNHVRQVALDHLRIATMLAVQSNLED